MAEGDTLVNAVIGAVVTAVAALVVAPAAPLIGGAVAGYLDGGERSDGLRVGALSGLVSLIPTALAGLVLVFVLGLLGFGALLDVGGALAVGAVGAAFLAVAALTTILTVVGLSALGGWVGNYLKYDTGL